MIEVRERQTEKVTKSKRNWISLNGIIASLISTLILNTITFLLNVFRDSIPIFMNIISYIMVISCIVITIYWKRREDYRRKEEEGILKIAIHNCSELINPAIKCSEFVNEFTIESREEMLCRLYVSGTVLRDRLVDSVYPCMWTGSEFNSINLEPNPRNYSLEVFENSYCNSYRIIYADENGLQKGDHIEYGVEINVGDSKREMYPLSGKTIAYPTDELILRLLARPNIIKNVKFGKNVADTFDERFLAETLISLPRSHSGKYEVYEHTISTPEIASCYFIKWDFVEK